VTIVNFDISSTDSPTMYVEAHGEVLQPLTLASAVNKWPLITEINAFFISYSNPEFPAEWMEVKREFFTETIGKDAFMDLLANIEESLIEEHFKNEIMEGHHD
jgi:hypothetical protein